MNPETNEFKSPCRHRPGCPGCPYIELSYEEQIDKKQAHLEEVLKDYRGILKPFFGAPEKDRLYYRNRAKLAVRAHGQFGLYRTGTHRLVYIPHCLIHMKPMNDLAQMVMREVVTRKIRLYDERQHKGFLRYIILRQSKSGDAQLLILVTRTRVFPGGEQFARALKRKVKNLIGVIQNINEERGNTIEGRENIVLAGKKALYDRMNNLRFVISGTSFLQGHHGQAATLYRLLVKEGSWKPDDLIYDLYSGIGLAGLHLASKVRQVVGIESHEGAVEDARYTAQLNEKKNMTFFPGKVEKMLSIVHKRLGEPDGFILNPPRTGCNAKVLDWIKRSSGKRLAYISCNPQTLARDLTLLKQGGFEVKSLQGIDLYPQTEQIECLAFLQRN